MKSKSIIEEALLEAKQIENAVKSNAKEILSSTMKDEIGALVKESINRLKEDEDEDTEDPNEVDETETTEQEVEDDETDTDVDDETDDEAEDAETEVDLDTDDEVDTPFATDDTEVEDAVDDTEELEDESDDFTEPSFETDDDTIDMTGASDDEVLKVFKAMGDEDGIVAVKDGDNINFKDENAGSEYQIKLDSDDEMEESILDNEDGNMFEIEMDEDESLEEGKSGKFILPKNKIKMNRKSVKEDEAEMDEMMYEIEVDDEEDNIEESKSGKFILPKNKIKMNRKEVKETVRTHAMLRKSPNAKLASAPEKENAKSRFRPAVKESFDLKTGSVIKENRELKSKINEYKEALSFFRTKLSEIALFNSNLAYATKLFTEHSTTKDEKMQILKRFDAVGDSKQSKVLYKTIKEELVGKPVTKETVAEQATKAPDTASSVTLNENKVYVDPQFSRMKEIMDKIS